MTGERDAGDSLDALDPRDLPDPPADVTVEPATPDDRLDVLRMLDAAMLETDAAIVDDRIAAADVLVARSTRTGGVVGALVAVRPDRDRIHVDAVAVRRARRGRGIGSALVAAVIERGSSDSAVDAVTATFDTDLEHFYSGLGFAIRPGSEIDDVSDETPDRLRGLVSVNDRE
ncbi:GCN5-related N-acetyltransferase [Halorubrum californiense DSM 19288]|uniref:GCN5-related N-acetyltransferase n=1 Tax=Halorubrum californiense DSM 19288 TaxID=1227465 RepID=M0E7P0_9EURY|nr:MULTISPECIES: GNAT family N-acetyltransferase [Halorubrum]ELZ43800.1 GCN5-related N-acetyltransferase [Halorubrum californiense DSM 19288]TKX72786.1 GNAT family N-acetyltransferase [Halorubrum sp. GN11GM_10-3_MGM]